MLAKLKGQKVLVHFIDGTLADGGILEDFDDKYIKYTTEYQELYIPITSVREIKFNLKERERPKVGFG
ncbi:hypothetical protein M3223_19680 [Paenibacillus pasadenensis]|uniref:hypothetical protein n=1 Tax=Paenibacillus pasadenensis TaxID=217090 RepID=UPI0020423E8A|nr:hypothetical protein [Paenibacillus pasadenensis]MCM3749576.1 hypothetical protein [Paenibacillus pasadenensis]